jgi:hypothetical protein
MISGERVETCLHAAEGSKEIKRLKVRGGERMETDEEGCDDKNESEVNGISIESEFAFTKAVGEFLKIEVREGGYKGNYVLNVKEQLRVRTLREEEEDRKLRVLLLGSSQLNRMGNEMLRRKKEKIEIVGRVRIEGVEMDRNMESAKRMVRDNEDGIDVVLVGGPGNSLVVHGKEGERGFAGEREVRILKKDNDEEDWTVRYHMTDPVKITMAEKAELVDRMVNLIEDIRRTVDESARVAFVTIPPRFVRPCCKEHMTDEDVWLLDGLRRDVNREIKDELTDRKLDVDIVDWWMLMGESDDLNITDIRKRDFLDSDNVHLKKRANTLAADVLCTRFLGRGGTSECGTVATGKRRKVD